MVLPKRMRNDIPRTTTGEQFINRHCRCRLILLCITLLALPGGISAIVASSADGAQPLLADNRKNYLEALLTLKSLLAQREEKLRGEAEKMQRLFEQGVVSRTEATKATAEWQAAVKELEKVEKEIAASEQPTHAALDVQRPATATEARDDKVTAPPSPAASVAEPPAKPSPLPDIASIAAQIEKTREEIKRQQQELQRLRESIAAAKQQIAAVIARLQGIIANARKQHERVHPLLIAAYDYLHVPYRWGGTTSRGLDCSGLVYRALARLGVRVPHSAALLFQRGRPVPVGAWRPGDLLFFANTYKPGISHVGIYLGGDRFLHASSGAGKVTMSSLRDRFYVDHFVGARRIMK